MTTLMPPIQSASIVALVSLIGAPAFGQTPSVVYEQPPRAPSLQAGGSFSTIPFGQANPSRVADGFTLSQPVQVTGVRFWGFSTFPNSAPPPVGYRIDIWESDGGTPAGGELSLGKPGTLVYTDNYLVGGLGSFTVTPSSVPQPLLGPDTYEWNFGNTIPLAGNRLYWISIAGLVAQGDTNSGFAWWNSNLLPNYSAFYNVFAINDWWLFGASNTFNPGGHAYALLGVPTPASGAMIAIVAMTGASRRRRR